MLSYSPNVAEYSRTVLPGIIIHELPYLASGQLRIPLEIDSSYLNENERSVLGVIKTLMTAEITTRAGAALFSARGTLCPIGWTFEDEFVFLIVNSRDPVQVQNVMFSTIHSVQRLLSSEAQTYVNEHLGMGVGAGQPGAAL